MYLIQNVNLDLISFTNNNHNLELKFIDSVYGSGKPCAVLTCGRILHIKYETNFDDCEVSRFPCFVCDVIHNKIGTLHVISFGGSDVKLEIKCENIRLEKFK